MASNQTSNYKLNQWAAEDRIIREEFNADNQKIETALTSIQATAAKVSTKADTSTLNSKIATVNSQISTVEAKIPKIVTGTYIGDDAEKRTISLGFTPKAVYVCRDSGLTYSPSSSGSVYGGLALPGAPVRHDKTTSSSVTYYTAIEIVTGGFTVAELEIDAYRDLHCNTLNEEYHYIALG